jgi:hypothetical protein
MHAKEGTRYDVGGQSCTGYDEDEFWILNLCRKLAQHLRSNQSKVTRLKPRMRNTYSQW